MARLCSAPNSFPYPIAVAQPSNRQPHHHHQKLLNISFLIPPFIRTPSSFHFHQNPSLFHHRHFLPSPPRFVASVRSRSNFPVSLSPPFSIETTPESYHYTHPCPAQVRRTIASHRRRSDLRSRAPKLRVSSVSPSFFLPLF